MGNEALARGNESFPAGNEVRRGMRKSEQGPRGAFPVVRVLLPRGNEALSAESEAFPAGNVSRAAAKRSFPARRRSEGRGNA